MASHLQNYLTAMAATRATAQTTGERSYAPVLQALLHAVGQDITPKVYCTAELKDDGAGHPDLGLFAASQIRDVDSPLPEMPERGVVEIKALSLGVRELTTSEQVTRYWERYGLVICTNFREFTLVGRSDHGRRTNLESFILADSEDGFWDLARTARNLDPHLALRFEEFLKRLLLHNTRLSQPKDVAWFLASYARDALARIESREEPAQIQTIRNALEGALGMTFEGDKGAHFFHSTLVQTLFYGLFSAWVVWSRKTDPDKKEFTHQAAAWDLKLPVLQALFAQVNVPGALGGLNLLEVMEWAALALRRVDEKAFFSTFEDDHAVQYFYEPFLEAFDPQLRKQLGVWYTPTEVVDYMVERVDQVLREELHIQDGLADENVLVLDPCTGTGSYLVSVLKRIEKTLREEKGEDALIGASLKKAAMERVFGFEIMPAPLVVAHVQLGLLLDRMGAPLGERHSALMGGKVQERPAVYLTNALTGWDEPDERIPYLPIAELQNELDDANRVKREKKILVIIGNPPYNGFAGVAVNEERGLSNAYRETVKVRAPEGQGLNDLMVRFYRMAERKITEMSGQGIVCFISNYAWLDGLSFTGMRERFLNAFDSITIDSLNGDSRKNGKKTPDGKPDPSIFSTDFNKAGIKVGTSIALLTRTDAHKPAKIVHFRDLWGTKKRQQLNDNTHEGKPLYTKLTPVMKLGLPFRPSTVHAHYFTWPAIVDLFPANFPGVKTARDSFLVSIDREPLKNRIESYLNPSISNEEISTLHPVVMEVRSRFDPKEVRTELLSREVNKGIIRPYVYRPFDTRWLYWEPDTKLLDEKRTEYVYHAHEGNLWLVAAEKVRRETPAPLIIKALGCSHLMERGGSCIPLYVNETAGHGPLFDDDSARKTKPDFRPNLSTLASLYLMDVDAGEDSHIQLFHHIAAMLHAPLYEAENGDALSYGWPRIPLPADGAALAASAALGTQVAILLDTEVGVDGVDTGRVIEALRPIATLKKVGGGQLDGSDFKLTAGWGRAQQGGVMPGGGDARVRNYSDDELEALRAAATAHELNLDQVKALLGKTCVDVHLNADAFWSGVPLNVWDYTIGGYQVVKKWLSYREYDILGRALDDGEVRYVRDMLRRLTQLKLMEPELDANYATCRDKAYA